MELVEEFFTKYDQLVSDGNVTAKSVLTLLDGEYSTRKKEIVTEMLVRHGELSVGDVTCEYDPWIEGVKDHTMFRIVNISEARDVVTLCVIGTNHEYMDDIRNVIPLGK